MKERPHEALVLLEVGEQERPRAPHLARVASITSKISRQPWREVDLVDDQQVERVISRSALARGFLAGRTSIT